MNKKLMSLVINETLGKTMATDHCLPIRLPEIEKNNDT